MKLLITGAAGFVAGHFLEYINSDEFDYEVLCLDKSLSSLGATTYKNISSIRIQEADLLDVKRIREIIKDFCPDYVLHLAALSSVASSWKHPTECFLNNTVVFLNIIEALHDYCPECRILSVGSSEEYGSVRMEDLPIRENQALNPTSPYAVARVSQEQLSRIFTESYGMNIVLTRSFNHIGPRQDDRFVVPSFIKRVVELKRSGLENGEIETGDISIIRDFVDVRDVVRGYNILLQKGRSGEVYNICSGRRISLKEVLDIISEEVGVAVTSKINPEYIRPKDSKETVGTYYKMEAEFGWKPEIELRQTIHDMVAWHLANC